ncbi:4'-phosphopantetheinyl transferase superfamily protein [Roseovarius sp. CAU 1744]|uniref:4'-phosphopantetheinyl transferase family protein n=1 Tax=Roseovarius sp. CAU 1744 TaxID=3140368 RepID=UPI00325B6E6A
MPAGLTVDLWLADLGDDSGVGALRGLLSAGEIDRANRFGQDIHRSRFILCRAYRRIVLADYLGCAASELIFDENGKNKPALRLPPDGQRLHFSTSQSGNQWLMAVATADIGVDIEALREIRDLEAMIGRVCSGSEARVLSAMQPADRFDHFFTLWTIKEAVAKLTGEGLFASFDAIDTGGEAAPSTARYQGQQVYLAVPDIPGPAKAMLAAHRPGLRIRQRDVTSLPGAR